MYQEYGRKNFFTFAVENTREYFTVGRTDSWNTGERKQVRHFFLIQGDYRSQRSVHKFSVFYTVTGIIVVSAMHSDPIF